MATLRTIILSCVSRIFCFEIQFMCDKSVKKKNTEWIIEQAHCTQLQFLEILSSKMIRIRLLNRIEQTKWVIVTTERNLSDDYEMWNFRLCLFLSGEIKVRQMSWIEEENRNVPHFIFAAIVSTCPTRNLR